MPRKSSKTLIFGDVHCPHGDAAAVRAALDELDGGGYGEVIINGDFLDMASMSRFGKDRETPTIEQELKAAGRTLSLLRIAAGKIPITYIQGNHELRLSARLNDLLPELSGLVSIPSLLRLDELGIEYVQSPNPTCHVERQGVLVGHFNRALKGAGKTAVELMRQYGMPVVQGHTHRLAAVSLRTYRGQMIGAESGCLCRLDPTYADCPDWTHGFVILERGVPRIVPLLK
jgi:hypothetical protein